MATKTRPKPSLVAILALAGRQHDVITLRQLLDAGLSREAIRHRVSTGRLHPAYPRVFAVGRPELPREGVWMAAVLACGPGAALSHLSAGELWRIWDGVRPRWPQVSVPTRSGRRAPDGIDLHRSGTLQANDITERDAISVTTLERTLLDLTSMLDAKQLKSVLRQAERIHKLDLHRLRSSLDALPRTNHRRARLAKVLDAYVPGTADTEGEPEAAFLELCTRYELPLPETQVPIGPYRVDFLWRDCNLVVEIDDRGSHDGYIAFREDRVRDRAMKARGLDVLRFTRAEVIREPEKVAQELRTARLARAVRHSSEREGA
jgi:hypothetical protein